MTEKYRKEVGPWRPVREGVTVNPNQPHLTSLHLTPLKPLNRRIPHLTQPHPNSPSTDDNLWRI